MNTARRNERTAEQEEEIEEAIDEELVRWENDRLALSIRLPFSKRRMLGLFRNGREPEYLDLALQMMRRTAQGEPWFARAHEQDIIRGTQRGTMGYLPIEIRQQIWSWFVTDVACLDSTNSAGDDLVVTNYNRLGTPYFSLDRLRTTSTSSTGSSPNEIRLMLQASYELGMEAQKAFFSHHTLAFYGHKPWIIFSQRIPRDLRQGFAFYFRVFEKTSWRQQEIDTKGWIDALAWLPRNTRCVTFEIGEFNVGPKKSRAGPKAELRVFDILNKRILRNAPRAVVRLAACHREHMPIERRKAIERVFADIER